MGNCSNISNTQSVSLTAGTITSGFCHTSLQTTYEEFIARTTASLSGNLAGFVAGDDTPSASDQDKLWYRQNASNCNDHLGWHFYNTTSSAWEAVKTPVSSLADNTQGDIIYYGASGVPAVLNAGTDGHYLKTKGAGQNPEWAEVPAVSNTTKAIRVANNGDTYFGASSATNGTTHITTTSVTLSGSTTHIIEWSVNLSENAEGGNMSGEVAFSTDNATFTKMYDVKQYELKTGGSGHGYYRNHHISFLHAFTTNSSGGTYYFRFDTNSGSIWRVHDMNVRVIDNVSDFGGGQTYTQA